MIVHRLPPPPGYDIDVVDAIPVTSAARTLIDLAAVAERDLVEEALDDALRRKLVTINQMQWLLDRQGRRHGGATIRALVAARDGCETPDSRFATRLLRAMRKGGLDPVVQHRVMDGSRLVAVVDFAFRDLRVAIEADGYEWHSGKRRWKHDLARGNALTALGWRVIHVTWDELNADPAGVVQRINRVLASSQA